MVGKYDLRLEGKDTKSVDQKAPFALGRNHIGGSDACVVMEQWHIGADPHHIQKWEKEKENG